MGGLPFSRGALFHLLRNQIYLGRIVHKKQVHDGGHAAVVDADLFDRVQQHLDHNARRHRAKADRKSIKAPLTGKLFDAAGEPMSPTTSRGKSGRTYRYYVSASLQQGARSVDRRIVQRLSAPAIESVVAEAIHRWMPRVDDPLAILRSVTVSDRGLQIAMPADKTAGVAGRLADGEKITDRTSDVLMVLLPITLSQRGGRRLVVPSGARRAQPDPVLISALRKAHTMLERHRGMPVIDAAPGSPHDRNILRLAFLAPDIQRAIIDGRQPHHLNLEALKKIEIPIAWSKQRNMLGFGDRAPPCSVE